MSTTDLAVNVLERRTVSRRLLPSVALALFLPAQTALAQVEIFVDFGFGWELDETTPNTGCRGLALVPCHDYDAESYLEEEGLNGPGREWCGSDE